MDFEENTPQQEEIINKVYDLQGITVHVRHASVADIQSLMPAEYIVSILPDVKSFRWACKYINEPSLMPDLKWQNCSVDKSVDKYVHKM